MAWKTVIPGTDGSTGNMSTVKVLIVPDVTILLDRKEAYDNDSIPIPAVALHSRKGVTERPGSQQTEKKPGILCE